jgi:hypothetical protein
MEVNTQGQTTMDPANFNKSRDETLPWGNSMAEVFGLDSPQVNVIVEN